MMQIFYLSEFWMIFLYFVLWFVFQVAAALICFKLPDRYLVSDGFLFKIRRWEQNGAFYNTVFKVKKWKRFLPDGGAVIKSGYRKKHLVDYSRDNLQRFLIESCRAELTHLLAILPFWVFGLFSPPSVIFIMLSYALAVNLPCIIAQRYNRPRLQKMLLKLKD